MAFRRTKRYQKRKGKAPLSRSQVKAVARIAKRVDIRNDETKCNLQGFLPFDSYGGLMYVNNVTMGVSQGVGRQQRIGVKITNPIFHYKVAASPTILQSGAVRYAQRVFLRVIIFKADHELNTGSNSFTTLTSGTALKTSDVLLDTGNDRFWNSWTNSREITVLSDRRVPLDHTWDVQGTYGLTREISGRVKLGKVIQFNDDTSASFLKHKNIYMAVTIGGAIPLGTSDLMGRVNVNTMLTYKDA